MRGMNLIIPPLCDITVPLLGAYQLAGFAAKKGFPLVVHDCNIAFCESIVTYSIKKARSVSSLSDLEEKAASYFLNAFPDITSYDAFISALTSCSARDQYWKLMDFIRACYALFSLQFTDIRFRVDGFDSEYRWNIWADIEQFAAQHKNGILYTLVNKFLDNIILSSYDTIGISITFENQLFFSILLCSAIREKAPNISIILGGGFINTFIDSDDSMGPLSNYCDCVFSGEGEALIDFLLNHKLKDLAEKKSGTALFVTPEMVSSKKLHIVPPLFEQKTMTKYVSPRKVIPLRFSYDCYWNKCKFCVDKEYHVCLNKQYDIDSMIEFCINGYTNGQFDGIFFLDSAISPNHAKKFAQALIDKGVSFPWGTNFRFEPAFNDDNLISLLMQSGLRFAKFGLESGSQKILDLMNKGVNVEAAASIIHKFREQGILTHTYIMAAYPKETDEDRKMTADFLLSDYSHPDNYNCSEFILYKNSKIAIENNYLLLVENENHGWHSASYNFSNDIIRSFIQDLRGKFNAKFKPQSILLSTGHTIWFAGKLNNIKNNSINRLYVNLNSYVNFEIVDTVPCLLWWKRNKGYASIRGVWAEWLYRSTKMGISMERLSEIGMDPFIVNTLIDEGCFIYCDSARNQIVNNAPNNSLFEIKCHSRFEKFKWYGYFDEE